MQSEEKDKKKEIKMSHQEKSNKISMGQLIFMGLTFVSAVYFQKQMKKLQ